jgi:hypothetical protein
MADDNALIVKFEPADEEPARVPIGIDLIGLLETLKAFYDGCRNDPVLREKYFRRPAASAQLDKLELLSHVDLDKLASETHPVLRAMAMDWINDMVRSIKTELPLGLLTDIVALEILRAVDTIALQHLDRIPDRQLRRELLDRLEYLIGQGFHKARAHIVRQLEAQIYEE